jgi:hypothetical protein
MTDAPEIKEKPMNAVRTHTYRVDPDRLEQLLTQRAALIDGIRAGNPGFLEARLTRHEDGTYSDVWRWESAELMTTALAAAAGFPLVAATLALTHDSSVQNGEIINER